jgi:hypothetical protein
MERPDWQYTRGSSTNQKSATVSFDSGGRARLVFIWRSSVIWKVNRQRQHRYSELASQIAPLARELEGLRSKFIKLRQQHTDFSEAQKSNAEMLPVLDQYEVGLRKMERLIKSLLEEDLPQPAEKQTLRHLLPIYEIRIKETEAIRTQAKMIVGFRPGVDSFEDLVARLEPFDREVVNLGKQAKERQSGEDSR